MKKKGTLLECPHWKELEGTFRAISIEGERVADGARGTARGRRRMKGRRSEEAREREMKGGLGMA